MRGLLGVGAAALDGGASRPPRLHHTTGLSKRASKFVHLTIALKIESIDCSPVRTSIFRTALLYRSTVVITAIKPRRRADAFTKFRRALTAFTPTNAKPRTRPAIIRVRRDIRTNTGTRRTLDTRQRQINVPMNPICRLIVEFRAKDSNQVHLLELNRLGLLHSIPRQRDRVRTLLTRSHERSVPDHSSRIRQRPADDIIYAIRVREHSCEYHRLSRGNFRHVGLQTNEHRRPSHWSCRRVIARRRGVTRITGFARSSHSLPTRIRGRAPGHRVHGRSRGSITPTASREDPQREHEVPWCTHASSMPGDASACNPGSQN